MKILSNCCLLLLFIFLTSESCKKSEEAPNGDVTCKIDGRGWTSYSDDFKLSEADGEVTRNWERVSINATNTKTSEKIGITVSTPGKVVTEGKYVLDSKNFLSGSYYLLNVGQFITGDGYQGEVEIISIDKTKSEITGKFQYNCYSQVTKQSVVITEGIFKVHYNLIN